MTGATAMGAIPRRLMLVAAAMVVAVLGATVVPAEGTPASERGLDPNLRATLDVNVVFIGFQERAFYGHEHEPHDFSAVYSDALHREFLPSRNDPALLDTFDVDGRPVPAHQRLTYRTQSLFADARFEQAFFDHLGTVGHEGPRTRFQAQYSDQASRQLPVTDRVLRIPGPAVERWLADNVWRLEGAKRGADTIVFINWFGRPDFRFHVYQGDSVDPDTGRDDRVTDTAGVAWGGTSERLWFYDLSAGPDYYNWNVDEAEFYKPFDGLPDHRVPPIWEMDGGNPEWLVADATLAVGLLARFSLFGLFGQSPVYDPLATVPGPGGERILRLSLFREDDSDPTTYLQPEYVLDGMHALQPELPTRSTLAEHAFTGDDALTFRIFTRAWDPLPVEPGCWQSFGHPVTQLHCHIEDNRPRLAPPGGPGDVVIPELLYAIENSSLEPQGEHTPLGVAYSITGPPHSVFAQTSPLRRGAHRDVAPGIGLTHLLLHENGHMVGLSHPHDGWDSELGLWWGPRVARFLYQLGECSCAMGYIAASPFGRFERDNLDRNLAARYYSTAVHALDDLPPDMAARSEADLRTTARAYADRDWRRAVIAAQRAYLRAVKKVPEAELRRAATPAAAHHRGSPPPGAIDHIHPAADPDPSTASSSARVVLPGHGRSGYVDRYAG